MSVYAFGPFILDTAGRRLTRDGQRLPVPGKAWQILLMLAEAGGRLVSHDAFRARLWPNIVVEDRGRCRSTRRCRWRAGLPSGRSPSTKGWPRRGPPRPREDGVRLGLGRCGGRPGACGRPQFQLGRSARHIRPVPERNGPPRRSDRSHGAGAAARSAQRRDAAASSAIATGWPARPTAALEAVDESLKVLRVPGPLWAHDDSRPAGRHEEAMAERLTTMRGLDIAEGSRARGSACPQQGLARGDGLWIGLLERTNRWEGAAQQWMAVGKSSRALDALEHCVKARTPTCASRRRTRTSARSTTTRASRKSCGRSSSERNG